MKSNKLPSILILAHARHGKDTLAEILRDHFGFTFSSSSQASSNIFIFSKLKDKYGYKTQEECFADRINHRAEWYDLICEYNKDDKTRLAREVLNRFNFYIGMRDKEELDACIKADLFDLIIWVDASERCALENISSFNIDQSVADIIITNNGSLADFTKKVMRLGKILSNYKNNI